MNTLYVNYISGEIQKQANPADFSQKLMHPTMWAPNPYTGILAAGGLLGGATGLMSSDSDDNKLLRALAGTGLGIAGTSALNNMGMFNDAIEAVSRSKGGLKSNAASQTKTEPSAPKPEAPAKAPEPPKPVPSKAKGGLDFLRENVKVLKPGQVGDVSKIMAQQEAQAQYLNSMAQNIQAQNMANAAKVDLMNARLAGKGAFAAQRAAAGPAGVGIGRRIAMGLPLLGRLFS
jgi:hypothetical protein